MRSVVAFCFVALAAPAGASTIRGVVHDDSGTSVRNAVVAFETRTFVTTDATGHFEIRVPDTVTSGEVWVRVPDGYTPGPVWAAWPAASGEVELVLRRLATPIHQPFSFVVASDAHIASSQKLSGAFDLATATTAATALDPPPAFFTIAGDITQGGTDAEFELVDTALSELGVPWVPVPGNHDWYDAGAAWLKRYGPDNYSFDIANVHFVVWNMALDEPSIQAYLAAELARVPKSMTIIALTHAPPSVAVIETLRALGVRYVFTGHAHSNRAVDHDGLIELNTEPLLMGGLDFTPGGYRVVTISGDRVTSSHHTTVDAPALAVIGPGRGQCTPALGGPLLVAAELDAGTTVVSARIDCAAPIALHAVGGWDWRGDLPPLLPGTHAVVIEARAPSGARADVATTFEVCDPAPAPPVGTDWPQLGGGAGHDGARAHELAPPLATRWVTAIGGHLMSASPAIANGIVYVAVTDLGDGDRGGVVALDLATGAIRWRTPAPIQIRGGVAVAGSTVIAARIDGVILGLDAATGAERWRHEMSANVAPEAGVIFASVATDGGDALIGHQRDVAVLAGATGTLLWHRDPVPEGENSQSLAAIAIGGGLALGTFNRLFGGVIAWDRATGAPQWHFDGDETVGINATPVIAGDSVFVVNAADQVTSIELGTGLPRWTTQLDPDGFAWGNATVGTPAYAHGILVVPTLYRDLIALDATSGAELWRHGGLPSPLRATHYRGAAEAGYEASPAITGEIVWAADTSGELAALDLRTGDPLWRTAIGAPVLSGLAASGDWLVTASYDGTVRAFVPTAHEPAMTTPASCGEPAERAGCCNAAPISGSAILTLLVAAAVRRKRRA